VVLGLESDFFEEIVVEAALGDAIGIGFRNSDSGIGEGVSKGGDKVGDFLELHERIAGVILEIRETCMGTEHAVDESRDGPSVHKSVSVASCEVRKDFGSSGCVSGDGCVTEYIIKAANHSLSNHHISGVRAVPSKTPDFDEGR